MSLLLYHSNQIPDRSRKEDLLWRKDSDLSSAVGRNSRAVRIEAVHITGKQEVQKVAYNHGPSEPLKVHPQWLVSAIYDPSPVGSIASQNSTTSSGIQS